MKLMSKGKLSFTSFEKIIRNNVLNKSNAKKIKKRIDNFFLFQKNDPQFITLDTQFINNPSPETYSNLIIYFSSNWERFKKELIDEFNINEKLIILNNYAMDDNFLPMYNYNAGGNTWERYIKGKIEFDNKDQYTTSYRGMINGYKSKFVEGNELLVFSKLGQGEGIILVVGPAGAVVIIIALIILIIVSLIQAAVTGESAGNRIAENLEYIFG